MSRDIHSAELCKAIEKWVVNRKDNPSAKELTLVLEGLGLTDVDVMIADAIEADCVEEKGGKLYVKGC